MKKNVKVFQPKKKQKAGNSFDKTGTKYFNNFLIMSPLGGFNFYGFLLNAFHHHVVALGYFVGTVPT